MGVFPWFGSFASALACGEAAKAMGGACSFGVAERKLNVCAPCGAVEGGTPSLRRSSLPAA